MKLPWKVFLFEAQHPVPGAKAAELKEVYNLMATGLHEAKYLAKEWLKSRGLEMRSLNVSADKERTLLAYVKAK
jgi:hypothetical protein